ncbi:MAG: hypothetical protein U9Q33_11600 [Campylobacterota bacterium]|nr:hypothetical protein [Campylobacterota bacterium]
MNNYTIDSNGKYIALGTSIPFNTAEEAEVYFKKNISIPEQFKKLLKKSSEYKNPEKIRTLK